jgi:hypothetical protein
MTSDLRRYRDLLATGATRGQVDEQIKDGELVRASRGVYGKGDLAASDSLRALFLRLPPGSVLGFRSAAAMYGFDVRPDAAVDVVVPAGTVRPRIRGVRVHEAVVPVEEHVALAGIPCVPAARCAVDLARTRRRLDALPVLDAALRANACTPAELAAEVLRHQGLKGVRQARELIPLADPRPECRQESQLRLVVIDAGLPVPEPQLWVCDEYGTRLYRLDLAYQQERVGLEYDGMSHLDRRRLRGDRDRMNWLDDHHWTMRYFTDRDLYQRPSYIIAQVRSALARS